MAHLWRGLRLLAREPALRDVAACIQISAAGPAAKCYRGYSTAGSEGARIFGAVVLERLPVVVREEADWVTEHRQWQRQFYERVRKRYPDDFTKKKSSAAVETAEESAMGWVPGERVTEADRQNDTKSLQRKLDDRLVLIVKGTDAAGKGTWQLPAVEHVEGETIRQTAERAALATVGEGPKTYFVGNAPAGHFPDRSPPAEERSGGGDSRGRRKGRDRRALAAIASRADAADVAEAAAASGGAAEGASADAAQGVRYVDDGSTTFYVKAQLIKGEVPALRKGSGWYDYAWITADEVPQYFDDPTQQKFLEEML